VLRALRAPVVFRVLQACKVDPALADAPGIGGPDCARRVFWRLIRKLVGRSDHAYGDAPVDAPGIVSTFGFRFRRPTVLEASLAVNGSFSSGPHPRTWR